MLSLKHDTIYMEIKKETCYHVQCLGKWVHNSKPTQGRTTRRRGGPRGGRGSRVAGLRGTGRARGRRRGARRRGRYNVVGAAGAAGLRETGRARGRRGARRRRQGRRGRGAVGAAGRPRRRGMTSRGGCTDRAARTPRCAAARARKKAAGEEGGGARGRVCWAI